MEHAGPSSLNKSLQGKIALVTGASRGIGRAAAIALGAAGAHVICVARTVGGLEETDDAIAKAGGTATLVPLNLKDFAAIDRLGASIFDRWGRLDAFLGNAGVLGTLTPLTHLEPKDFVDLLDINITANWRLIRSLDPLLRLSDAGRVLFLTSGAARKHTPYWGGYAMSKAALESLALTYAAECEGGGKVKVNLLNPGPIRTAMRAKAMPGENPSTLKRPEELTPLIAELLSPSNQMNGELVNFQS
jgi:NAD(P)-dependent dehydrogenase (short-subunit alcohol dehydrogenase family)